MISTCDLVSFSSPGGLAVFLQRKMDLCLIEFEPRFSSPLLQVFAGVLLLRVRTWKPPLVSLVTEAAVMSSGATLLLQHGSSIISFLRNLQNILSSFTGGSRLILNWYHEWFSFKLTKERSEIYIWLRNIQESTFGLTGTHLYISFFVWTQLEMSPL